MPLPDSTDTPLAPTSTEYLRMKADELLAQKEAQKIRMREWRAKRRALGLRTSREPTDEDRKRGREKMAARRKQARDRGERLSSETWWMRNRDKHRDNTANWRKENLEKARELTRSSQSRRRSTPWGVINNRLWPLMHTGVRRSYDSWGKYNVHLGYTWLHLRQHLEAQFSDGMTWENWGDHWEVDHIRPLSSFQFTSVDDPLFRQAWGIANLRPLTVAENMAKGKSLIAA